MALQCMKLRYPVPASRCCRTAAVPEPAAGVAGNSEGSEGSEGVAVGAGFEGSAACGLQRLQDEPSIAWVPYGSIWYDTAITAIGLTQMTETCVIPDVHYDSNSWQEQGTSRLAFFGAAFTRKGRCQIKGF